MASCLKILIHPGELIYHFNEAIFIIPHPHDALLQPKEEPSSALGLHRKDQPEYASLQEIRLLTLLCSIPFLRLQFTSVLFLDLYYFVIHDYPSPIFSLSFHITFLLCLVTLVSNQKPNTGL